MHETHLLVTKNVGLYTWRGGGRVSEKVYCLYTHENVDIFGWPLIRLFKSLFCWKDKHTKSSQSMKGRQSRMSCAFFLEQPGMDINSVNSAVLKNVMMGS